MLLCRVYYVECYNAEYILPNVALLNVIVQSNIMLNVVMLSDIIVSVIMLNVITECRYAESHYVECSGRMSLCNCRGALQNSTSKHQQVLAPQIKLFCLISFTC